MSSLTIAEVLRTHGLAGAEEQMALELGEWLDEHFSPHGSPLSATEIEFLSNHAGIEPADAQTAVGAAMSSSAYGVLSTKVAWTAEELAEQLGLTASSVRRRLAARELYALDRKASGKRLFPKWQVHDGETIPYLEQVLAELPRDLSTREVEEFFCARDTTALDEVTDSPRPSVREWLIAGGAMQPVLAAARRLADRGA